MEQLNEMLIRLADRNDIEILIRLRLDYLEPDKAELSGEMKERIESELRSYMKKHLNDDFFAAFAEADGKIVSVAFLVIFERPANPHWPTGRTGTIYNVLTYPAYRQKGYASAILSRLIEEGKRRNVSFIDLSASEMGKTVYQKLGFQLVDHSKSAYADMRLPCLE
jgi:GNAT superfamily N-acetyltransferase